jgi:hypothetical protein
MDTPELDFEGEMPFEASVQEVGERIVQALNAKGIETEWDGNPESIIRVIEA